jgi:hypothetical protein
MPLPSLLRRAAAAVAAVALALPAAAHSRTRRAPPPVTVSIIANRDVPVDDLSLAELRQIFRADQRFWRGGRRPVRLYVRAPDASERTVVLGQIYRMTERQFAEYWVRKRFATEVATNPPAYPSAEVLRAMVARVSGGVTFVPLGREGAGVKVLRIDGRRPGELGYPLQCEDAGGGRCRFPR